MKRLFAITLVLCLLLSLTGCDALDYTVASLRYRIGHYEKAYALYSALGDYADSAAMTAISRKKADYAAAQAHYAAGEYRQAMELFYGLDMYMDSPVKAVESQYALGISLLEEGDYRQALPLLDGLGNYEDSAQQTQKAVTFWLMEALGESDGAVLELEGEEDARLSLVINDSDSVGLIYESTGLLLGLPLKSRFALYLHPLTRTADYSATYLSTASRTILENAVGVADLSVYNAEGGLDTTVFVQSITEPDGTETVSFDTADAIILHELLPKAAEAIAQNLPALLAITGTDITPEQLGFLSLN